MRYSLILLLAGAFMLSACGKEDDGAGKGGDEGQAGDWDGGGVAEVPSSGEVKDSGLGYEYVVVDHGKDVKEFQTRRSIAGKEAMIEHYEEEGWDTNELEKELKDLQQQLEEMTSE